MQRACPPPWCTGIQLLTGVVLMVVLLLAQGPQAQAAGTAQATGATPVTTSPGPLDKLRPLLKPSAPSGQLQEVAAPIAVQQIQEVLADRQPRITIEAPRDGANLASGNWTLKLNVQDWPLHDGGALGIGPHVVVQIDDQAPIRLTEHRSGPSGQAVQLTLPPLAPGSHRITTYAATPWGEAARTPGATSQIRVDRVAANPLTLPEVGSPQVLGVSPMGTVGGEPVLLDWLLLDAPLQHLRDNDGSWRLRITVNDDRFVVDQNVPLWLKGWKTGSNSLQLDLVDGRGKPLNPPFNSLVSEVVLKPATNQPRWLQGRLSPTELVSLLGQTPPEPTPAPTPSRDSAPTKPKAKPSEAASSDANGSDAIASEAVESNAVEAASIKPEAIEPEVVDLKAPETQSPELEAPQTQAPAQADTDSAGVDPADASPALPHSVDPDSADRDPAEVSRQSVAPAEKNPAKAPASDASMQEAFPPEDSKPEAPTPKEPTPKDLPAEPAAPSLNASAMEANPVGAGPLADEAPIFGQNAAPDQDALATTKGVTGQDQATSEPGISGAADADHSSDALNTSSATSAIPAQAAEASITPGQPKPIANPDRVSPSSNVEGTAREQVREDGSLIKPKRQGLWGGLLDRLGA